MYAASHILISYADAVRSTQSRTQEEALFLACELREKIRQNIITFEQAAQTHSDCPSKVNQGNLGSFKVTTMEQDFIAYLDQLQPGEISGVSPTVYGYHIIRRN